MGENTIEVKAGDKALITKLGVKYLSGAARGKINIDDKERVINYDVDNIVNRISRAIKRDFGCDFDYYMEDNEVEMKDLENIIWNELSEFI